MAVIPTVTSSDDGGQVSSEHKDAPSAIAAKEPLRKRAMSHQQYLASLPLPNEEEMRRIESIQLQHTTEVDEKYQTMAEHDAAATIQRAYRGHRERRQLNGMTLDPSSRWSELIRELRFRSVIAQPHENQSNGRERSATCASAREYWSKAARIAERASAGACDLELASNDGPLPADDSMLMDLRYFLEMVDEKHRYGSNLQMYHEEWRGADTNQNFFQWLDHGEGRHISLPYCDRAKLDRERIRYLSREERQDYLVEIDDTGRLRWAKNGSLISTDNLEYRDSMHGIVTMQSTEPAFGDASTKEHLSESRRLNRELAAMRKRVRELFISNATTESNDASPKQDGDHTDGTDGTDDNPDSDSDASSTIDPDDAILHHGVTCDKTPTRSRLHVSPATLLNHLLRKSVRKGTWIYVADTVGRLYVGIKSSGAFQHASFLSGGRISSAGCIAIVDGRITYLSPLSGHYRPTTHSFRAFLNNLRAKHVDLSRMRISSAYQILWGMEHYSHARAGIHRWTAVRHKDDKAYRPA